MGSARCTALALCVAMALSGQATAADAAPGPAALPVSPTSQGLPAQGLPAQGLPAQGLPAQGLPAPDDAELVVAIPAEDGAAQRYQTLSTLGALALGIIGLLWVRRHTAEL